MTIKSDQYDHPDNALMREVHLDGPMSASAAETAFVGSTLRSYTKAGIVGVTFKIASGGSISNNGTIEVCKLNPDGTVLTAHQKQTCAIQATTAAPTVYDVSLTTPLTLTSFQEAVVLKAPAGTIADKGCVLGDIVWRYKLLP